MKVRLQVGNIVLHAGHAVVTGMVVTSVDEKAGQHPFNFPIAREDVASLEPGTLYEMSLTPVDPEGGKS